MSEPFQVLMLGAAPPALAGSAWGPFDVHPCGSADEASQHLREQPVDAIWLALPSNDAAEKLLHWSALSHAVLDAAVIVTWPQPLAALAARLIERGVQDVLPHEATSADSLARALRMGIERKRNERSARRAYATDLATGLPNHAQLLEHMTHLLALREREPAPMALVIVRIEGLATVADEMGPEAANVLRRKVAVRLRAGLRASDVVASIGPDTFAVLLAWMDEGGAAERVAAKLATAMQQPFSVTGRNASLAVSVGVARYPDHGREASALLRLAVGQAAGLVPVGRAGFANRIERGPVAAANDDEAPA